MARKLSLVLRLLKLPVRAKEPCTKTEVGETPIVSAAVVMRPQFIY